MNNAIWKFALKITDRQSIKMPQGAKILCVQKQGDVVYLWAQATLGIGKDEFRRIVIIGTGMEYDSACLQYIGTVQDRQFIWHVFEDSHPDWV